MPLAKTTSAAVQRTPHAPQFETLRTLVSQPVFSVRARQWAYPSAHFQVHAPAAHVGAPFAVLQVFPQPPQFKRSLESNTQKPPQHVPPVPQGVPVTVQASAQV